jgi:hypothetical protein
MPDQHSQFYQPVYQKPTLTRVGGLCDLTSGGSGGNRESKSKSSKKKKRSKMDDGNIKRVKGDSNSGMLQAGLFIPTVHAAKSKSKRP